MKKNKKNTEIWQVFSRVKSRELRAQMDQPTRHGAFTMHLEECYVVTCCVRGRQYRVSTWENVFPASHTKCHDVVCVKDESNYSVEPDRSRVERQTVDSQIQAVSALPVELTLSRHDM